MSDILKAILIAEYVVPFIVVAVILLVGFPTLYIVGYIQEKRSNSRKRK